MDSIRNKVLLSKKVKNFVIAKTGIVLKCKNNRASSTNHDTAKQVQNPERNAMEAKNYSPKMNTK